MWRALLWIPYIVIFLIGILIGLPLVGVLSWRRAWVDDVPSKYFKDGRKRRQWKYRPLTWLWCSDEDGVQGSAPWWLAQTAAWSDRWRAFKWSALRNPVGNLCYVPWINPVIDPARIRYKGNCMDVDEAWHNVSKEQAWWTFTWQGMYSGAHICRKNMIYRLGWKLKPSDKLGLADTDYRKVRCGFAIQRRKES